MTVLNGQPGAEGIAWGKVHRLKWGIPSVPHRMVDPERVADEVLRFHEAREWTRGRIQELRDGTEARLGTLEARIFDPQSVMLDDPEVVDGTVRYIEQNRLTAARAFEWRMMELQAMWRRTAHPMVLDKLSDLEDLQIRLLHRLLGLADPADVARVGEPVVVVARNLTPSLIMQMDPEHVLALATDQGTRTSHWVMLARSLKIPVVVGLGDVSGRVRDGQGVIVDGRTGRVVIEPGSRDIQAYQGRKSQIRAWEEDLQVIAGLDAVTADGQPVALRANLDLPSEAEAAREHGAEGVGLFRTEFIVVGRSSMPNEEDQYEAYSAVARAFPTAAVFIRTFDLGGDKFPMFLHMPPEENPFLGWRAIRVCLDEPDLFRTQLRAILRATAHGDVRIMVPMVNEVREIRQVRALLGEEEERLRADGVPFNAGYKLGVLVETPAAALDATELARHCDFLSIGTNDLVQYTLAVDRTNVRLARLYQPFHTSVLRQLHQVARASKAAGIEVSVCGELAAAPLGTFLLLGLDITSLSVAWPVLPEVKKFVRSIRMEDARAAARRALAASSAEAVVACLREGIGDAVDLSVFSDRWGVEGGE
ncbi:MAG TPA: phosphoenolpyruvate--protein phosphotransferase [Longimicrobiales bacterium]